jgi:hypothetical protein
MRINEVNSPSLKGSMGSNLIENKFRAFTELSKIKNNFDTIYILGSWYGNAGLLLSMDPRFEFDEIINVEKNKNRLKISDQLAKLQKDPRIKSMHKDANQLNYKRLGPDGLVVNFSCTNITGNDWFNQIPDNTMVLLSGRNNDEGAVHKFNSVEQFSSSYPLTKILFSGQQTFEDPETEYDAYLVIGTK